MNKKFEDLIELTKYLRGPDGCPWDKEQDLLSLRSYIIEEAYEVIQAIESGNKEEMYRGVWRPASPGGILLPRLPKMRTALELMKLLTSFTISWSDVTPMCLGTRRQRMPKKQ